MIVSVHPFKTDGSGPFSIFLQCGDRSMLLRADCLGLEKGWPAGSSGTLPFSRPTVQQVQEAFEFVCGSDPVGRGDILTPSGS